MTTALASSFTTESDYLGFISAVAVDYKITLTLSNGTLVSATKISDTKWRDDQSHNESTSEQFAAKVSTLPSSVTSTISVVTSPWVLDTPEKFINYLNSTGKYGLNTELLNVMNLSLVHQSQSSSLPISPFSSVASISDPAFIVAVDKALDKIDAAKELLMPDLSKSQKIISTKVKKRLSDFKKILEACYAINNGAEAISLDVFDSGLGNSKEQFPFECSTLKASVSKAIFGAKFKSAHGFDPFSSSISSEKFVEVITALDESYSWSKYLIGKHDSYIGKLALHVFSKQNDDTNTSQFLLGDSVLVDLKNEADSGKFQYAANQYADKELTLAYDPNGLGYPDFDMGSDRNNAIRYILSDAYTERKDYDYSGENLTTYLGHLAKYVPKGIALSLRRAFYSNNSDGPVSSYVLSVLKTMLFHGSWYPKDASLYTVKSKKVLLDPGMSIYQYASHYCVFVPKMVEPTGSLFYLNFENGGFGSSEFNGTHELTLIQQGSSTISYQDSKTVGKSFDSDAWSVVEAAEEFVVSSSLTGPQILAVKNALDSVESTLTVSSLSPKVASLIALYPQHVALILFKGEWGHYTTKGDNSWNAFQAKHPEFVGIEDPENSTQVSKLISTFDVDQTNSAITVLGGVNNYPSSDVLGAKFSLREALFNWKTNASKTQELGVQNGVRGVLKPIPSLNLGGGQAKTYFVDPDGNLFMGKPNHFEKFRPDAEYAANEIGRMFGYNIPDSTVREVDGVYTHVQQVVTDVDHDLMSVKPLDLSDETLIQALRAHPLHWSIANHDLTGENFLVDGNKNVHVIDLGQAWKALGKDKLEVGWKLAGNYGTVWYNSFFASVQEHLVPIDRLNKITKAVLRKARYISEKRETEYAGWLDVAFANRTFYPDGMTKQDFIDLAMARKHSVFDDFVEFYNGLYAAGGYEFAFTDQSFNSTRLEGTDAHLVVDDSFAEQVKKNAIYGKSVFFADADIEDAHAFFYTIQRGKGTSVHIEIKIRKDGDKRICKWVDSIGLDNTPVALPPKPEPKPEPLSNNLPWADEFILKLVAFAKTVNHHYSDKEYNKETVASAKSAADDIKLRLGLAKMDSSSLGSAFHTEHQRDHWIAWAEGALAEYDSVFKAYSEQAKAPMVSTYYTYVAPKVEAPKPVKAKKPKSVVSSDKFKVKVDSFSTLRTSEASNQGITTFIQNHVHNTSWTSYFITHPSHKNVLIQYTSHSFSGPTSSNRANTGRLQIDILEWDGSAEQLENALNLIRSMGIALEEASDNSLELFFWRHLANILKDRKLTKEKEHAAKISVQDIKMGSTGELSALKAAFANLWGAQMVDQANWHPHFGDFRAHFLEPVEDVEDTIKSGRPHWMRPDFVLADYKKFCNGVLPWRSDSDSAYLINGGYLANEEKIRFTGNWGTRSNSADADRQKGSSQFSFVRQGYLSGDTGFYIEPEVVGRTHNYAFPGDHFGAVADRVTHAPFSIEASACLGYNHKLPGMNHYEGNSNAGGNELMIKYGWSTWDDIAILSVPNASERKIILNFYKSKGITEIRGLSIEDRVVYSRDQAVESMQKIWDMYLTS